MLKKFLTPLVAVAISSDTLLNIRRRYYQLKHLLNRSPHRLKIFIALDDPYSHILLQCLPNLLARYRLSYQLIVINERDQQMFPDLTKWHQHSRKDAMALATQYQLMPITYETHQGCSESVKQHYLAQLIAACHDNNIEQATKVLSDYWHAVIPATLQQLTSHHLIELKQNYQLLSRLGHYASAMINYDGEWYWGIDRLAHLERRLNHLAIYIDNPDVCFDKTSLANEVTKSISTSTPLEIFYSARSPYSYIALAQAASLAKQYQLELIIKPVMPMVMRNLTVPTAKKMYIFHDAKREAKQCNIPFGRVADPLGQAVIDCYAIYPYAASQNKQLAFLLSFGQAVYAQGLHADNPKNMAYIVQRAGLDWQQAKTYLNNQQYLAFTADNLAELTGLGLWGVPCFRYGDTVTWGQDRLWLIEQAITTEHHTPRQEHYNGDIGTYYVNPL